MIVEKISMMITSLKTFSLKKSHFLTLMIIYYTSTPSEKIKKAVKIKNSPLTKPASTSALTYLKKSKVQ